MKRLYLSLRKTDEHDDGTVTVSGVASSEAVDAAGEVIQAEAMKAALPGFFAHGTGPLREMHQPLAAGTVDAAEVNDAGETLISATVVDPVAVLKIKSGVYKGFSIGGKVLARDPKNRKLITKIRLVEISLVDAPCNPEAVLDVWKADLSQDESMPPETEGATAPNDTTAAQTAAPTAAAPEVPAVAEPAAPAAETVPETPTAPAVPAAEPATSTETATAAETAPAPEAAATPPEAEPAPPETTEKAAPVDPLARALAAVDTLEAAVGKANEAQPLAKSIYSVSRFAEVIQSIYYLVREANDEADFEGDNSPVPAKLRAWLVQGAAIFKEMATEEVDELVARVTMKKAEEAEALAKVAETDALAKADALTATLNAKVAERDEAFAKLADRVEPLAQTIEALTKRLAAVEAQPAPAKTAGTFAKVDALSKEQDAAGSPAAAPAAPAAPSTDDVVKAFSALSPEDQALALTKAAHSRPMLVSR